MNGKECLAATLNHRQPDAGLRRHRRHLAAARKPLCPPNRLRRAVAERALPVYLILQVSWSFGSSDPDG